MLFAANWSFATWGLMRESEYVGWAIEARCRGPLCSTRDYHLLGRYWFRCDIPAHMEGHHTLLFKSRRLAREALPKRWEVCGNHNWYVPVRVRVFITKAEGAANPGRHEKDKE